MDYMRDTQHTKPAFSPWHFSCHCSGLQGISVNLYLLFKVLGEYNPWEFSASLELLLPFLNFMKLGSFFFMSVDSFVKGVLISPKFPM